MLKAVCCVLKAVCCVLKAVCCELLFKISSKINLATKVTGWLPHPVVELQVGGRSMRPKRH